MTRPPVMRRPPNPSQGRLRIRIPLLFEVEGEGTTSILAAAILAVIFIGLCLFFGHTLR